MAVNNDGPLNPAQLRNARLFLDRVGAEWDNVLDRLKLSVEEKL